MLKRIIQNFLGLGKALHDRKFALGLAGGRAKIQLSMEEAARLSGVALFSNEWNDDKKVISELPKNDKKSELAGRKVEISEPQNDKTPYNSDKAAGAASFKNLVLRSEVLVDKSLFVKEVVDNDNEAILITRPRRWGKTINMSMLKAFLEIEVNKDGGRLERSKNRPLFEGAEDYKVSEKKKKNTKTEN